MHAFCNDMQQEYDFKFARSLLMISLYQYLIMEPYKIKPIKISYI